MRFAQRALSLVLPAGLVVRATPDIVLIRYLPSGAPDPAFSGDGVRRTNLGGEERATAAGLQTDGKIVIAGSVGANAAQDFAIVSYKPSGGMDRTFAGGGIRVTDTSRLALGDAAEIVAIQPDGRIVVAGDVAAPSASPDTGRVEGLDRSFSGNGKAVANTGDPADASDLAVQTDGKLVVVGSVALDRNELGAFRFLG